MQQKFQQHLSSKFSFLEGKRLLIALSGGIDSMVLTFLMHNLNYDISIAHVNFQLRKIASNTDEQFVIDWAKTKEITFFTKKFDTKSYAKKQKLSIQMAARELRYDWFDNLIRTQKFDFLLTAHHLEDQLETFIINFSRGTGLEGLLGIPERNDFLVRPFLIFSKEEISQFALKNNILWVEDESNISDKYLRNKIRHHISPVLKSLHPTFLDNFQHTISKLKQVQHLSEIGYQLMYKSCVSEENEMQICNLQKLESFKHQAAFIYQWLKNYNFKAWQDLNTLCAAENGKYIESENYRVTKDRDSLVLSVKYTAVDSNNYLINSKFDSLSYPVKLSLKTVTETSNNLKKSIFVATDKIKFPIVVRKWNPDDLIYPTGMLGKKKVSKLLKDCKILKHKQSNYWVLCDNNNDLIWIIGLRADRRFSADANSKNILQFKLD